MASPDEPELRALASRLPQGADLAAGLVLAQRLELDWDLGIDSILPGATNCLVLAGLDSSGREIVLRVPLCDEESGPGYRLNTLFRVGAACRF